MMQERIEYGPGDKVDSGALVTNEGLAALLALAGSRRLDAEELGRRMRLSPQGFGSLLSWLQKEYLVDIVSGLDGHRVSSSVVLTDRGERVLVGLLEKMCELPEFS